MSESMKKLFKEFGVKLVKTVFPMVTTFAGVLLGQLLGGGDSNTATIGAVVGSTVGLKLV